MKIEFRDVKDFILQLKDCEDSYIRLAYGMKFGHCSDDVCVFRIYTDFSRMAMAELLRVTDPGDVAEIEFALEFEKNWIADYVSTNSNNEFSYDLNFRACLEALKRIDDLFRGLAIDFDLN